MAQPSIDVIPQAALSRYRTAHVTTVAMATAIYQKILQVGEQPQGTVCLAPLCPILVSYPANPLRKKATRTRSVPKPSLAIEKVCSSIFVAYPYYFGQSGFLTKYFGAAVRT